MHVGDVGAEADGGLVGLDGLLHGARVAVRAGEVGVRLVEEGVDPDRLEVVEHRLAEGRKEEEVVVVVR